MSQVIEAKGTNGRLEFDGHSVTIFREGLASLTLAKDGKSTPVASISAVQWKPAGPIMNGFIQFTIAGGIEVRSGAGRQTYDAVRDENSVVFTRKQMPAFEIMCGRVRHAIDSLRAPVTLVQSVGDELTKLADLLRQGLITEEEFAQQKARLFS